MRFGRPDSEGALEIRIDIQRGTQTPIGANYYQLARFGMEIQLMACFVDPQVVATKAAQAQAKNPGAAPKIAVQAEVLQRFIMSPQGFESLHAAVVQMHKAIHVAPESPKDE